MHRPYFGPEVYPPWDRKGWTLQQWIEDPTNVNERCKVHKSSLKISDLKEPYWSLDIRPELSPHGDSILSLTADSFRMGDTVQSPEQLLYSKVRLHSNPEEPSHPAFEWMGYIGPGIISISWLIRPQELDFVVLSSSDGNPNSESIESKEDPYMSEISKAIYESLFPLDTLQYVFITGITNDDTKRCLNSYISSDRREELFHQSWESHEGKYRAIMGTQLGHHVGNLILSAFGQGVKRKSRVTLMSDVGQGWDLRFDIEDAYHGPAPRRSLIEYY